MLRGQVEFLHGGPEHAEAQRLLRGCYAQMVEMAMKQHPVIAIRVDRVANWGDPGPDGASGRPSAP